MKMKFVKTGTAIALLSCWCVAPMLAQNTAVIKKSAQTAAVGVSVSTVKGKTTLTYKGKEVWSGKTTGKVTAKNKVVNGEEYVAAWDGQKVIWENVAGAAKQFK